VFSDRGKHSLPFFSQKFESTLMANHPRTPGYLQAPEEGNGGGGIALVGLGIICLLSWLSASAEDGALTGSALAAAGLLMLWQPVRQRVPIGCWIAGSVWLFGSLLAFLPAETSAWPAWREALAAAGVDTGMRFTPQPMAALGSLAVMTATGLVALWAACQNSSHYNRLAIGFVAAVAIHALVAWLGPGLLNFKSNASGTFGFFPNRNHTATLLVMGSMVSLGLLVQGVRWRCPWQIPTAGVALLFLLWMLFGLSISRAGIFLLACGAGLWLLLAGPRYLHGHVGKAVALIIGGSLLMFPLLDTPVRQRVEETLGKFTAAPDADDQAPLVERLEHLDLRVAIHRDAAAMISAAPLGGWGAGQFVFVFPQYQEQTAAFTTNIFLHPESDWLWMAAESGIPATLALAGLALALVIPALRSVRRGRARALRAGLLVAALILPLHGFLDVPGHRFSLLWSAAALLGLAAGARAPAKFPRISTIGWRLAGLAVAALGAAILYGNATGRPLLADDRSERLLAEAGEIYRAEHRRANSDEAAAVEPVEDQPDPLERGIQKLNQAAALTPLEQRLFGLRGMLALHFDDMDELARQSFAIQRLLEPRRINLPLNQADAWSRIDAQETRDLWLEAMRRARLMGKEFPATPWETQAYDQILRRARGSDELRGAALEAAGGDSALLKKAGWIPPSKDAKHAQPE